LKVVRWRSSKPGPLACPWSLRELEGEKIHFLQCACGPLVFSEMNEVANTQDGLLQSDRVTVVPRPM
jgi:hypothetical protein